MDMLFLAATTLEDLTLQVRIIELGAVAILTVLYFWLRTDLKGLRGTVENKLEEMYLTRAAEQIQTMLQTSEMNAKEMSHLLAKLEVQAAKVRAGEAPAAPASPFHFQFGTAKLTFHYDANFVDGEWTFLDSFPHAPVIAVAVSGAGSWMIPRVRNRTSEGFSWGVCRLPPFSGSEQATLQWIAIGLKGTMKKEEINLTPEQIKYLMAKFADPQKRT